LGAQLGEGLRLDMFEEVIEGVRDGTCVVSVPARRLMFGNTQVPRASSSKSS
jgi:hypothetical protein